MPALVSVLVLVSLICGTYLPSSMWVVCVWNLVFYSELDITKNRGSEMFINCTICSQGIGIALLVSQALIGIYSIVGVSWMFIYFRDSFITKQDSYQWADPYDPYRDGKENVIVSRVIFSTWGFLGHTDYIRHICNVKCSWFITLKCHYYSTGYCISNHSQQSFPVPRSCGIIDHPNVVLVAQTSDATLTLLMWRLLARKFDVLNVSNTSSGTTSTLNTQMCSPSLNS